MLAFYPEFEVDEEQKQQLEFIIAIDASCSMEGQALEDAKKVALLALMHLPNEALFNIVVFGSLHDELFPACVAKSSDTVLQAKAFIKSLQANWGGTELW